MHQSQEPRSASSLKLEDLAEDLNEELDEGIETTKGVNREPLLRLLGIQTNECHPTFYTRSTIEWSRQPLGDHAKH